MINWKMVFRGIGVMMLDNFDFTSYKQSSWRIKLHRTTWGELRLIIFVTTGRKESVLCSVVPTFSMVNDPALQEIKRSLKYYTFPMIDRFVNELEIILSDLYDVKIKFSEL
jgi:hypothetical protein